MQVLPIQGIPTLEVEIWVPGRPTQWERGTPIKGKRGAFIVSSNKNRRSQNIIKEAFGSYLRSYPEDEQYFPWKDTVRMSVHSFYPLPKKHILNRGARIVPKNSAPDVSNLLKQPEDAFNVKNDGLPRPYFDDAVITQAYTTKQYHPYLEGTMIVLELFKSVPRITAWESFDNTYGCPRNLYRRK